MKTLIFKKLITFRNACRYDVFKEQILKAPSDVDWEKARYDIKLHRLIKGKCPCRPIWHYDGTNNPLETATVGYSLLLVGDAICRTQFFKNEPILEHYGNEGIIHRQILSLTQVPYKIKYDIWNMYTSNNIHKASFSENTGERLLLRAKFNEH